MQLHCGLAEVGLRVGHLEEAVTKLKHDEMAVQLFFRLGEIDEQLEAVQAGAVGRADIRHHQMALMHQVGVQQRGGMWGGGVGVGYRVGSCVRDHKMTLWCTQVGVGQHPQMSWGQDLYFVLRGVAASPVGGGRHSRS